MNDIKTIARQAFCEYAGRVVPVLYTYEDGRLISIECPKNVCTRSRNCKAVQEAPKFLQDISGK